MWVFWDVLAVRSGRSRVVWRTAGDAWVGNWRLPPLAGDAWRTAVTPDVGQHLPVRERERAASVREIRRWVRASGS